MPKEIKEVKVVKSKKDEIVTLLKKRVYDIFDRTPNGSIRNDELSKLVNEIIKV